MIRPLLILAGLLASCAQADEFWYQGLPTANQERLELGPHARVFEDPSGSLLLEQLPAPEDPRWRSSGESVPSFGFSDSRFWFHFRLQRPPSDSVLVVSNPLLDWIEVYWTGDDGLLNSARSGDRLPFSQRRENHRLFLFPVPDQGPRIVDLYVSVASSTSVQVPITLWQREALRVEEIKQQTVGWLYAGLMLGMLLYNAFLFAALRERSYLFYVLYIGFTALYFGVIKGVLYQLVWPDWPGWNELSLVLVVLGAIGFSALFTASYLDLRRQHPRMNRLVFGWGLLAVSSMFLAPFVPYPLIATPLAIVTLLSGLLFTTAGVTSLRSGYRPARFYVLAWAVFLAAVVAFTLAKLGLLASNDFNENGPIIGSAIEALLLSFGLADRFNLFREQAARASTDQLRARGEAQSKQSAALRRLITGMSHQLNKPLSGGLSSTTELRGACQRFQAQLRDGPAPSTDEVRRFIEGASDGWQHALLSFQGASSMVKRFKQIAVQEHNEQPKDFRLLDCLERALTSVGAFIRERDIETRLSCDPDIRCRGFPLALTEVVEEALSNAAIHAFQGTSRPPCIALSATAHESSVRIVVRDNGIGIGPTSPERMFDPFHSSDGGQEGRLGLGLYIAQGVVTQRLGGRIELRGHDVGSELTLVLPMKAPPQDDRDAPLHH